MSRLSEDAVMSRKVSSSAPSASYFTACSTGSPASTSETKRIPLTTRPRSTSRHGIIRLASIGISHAQSLKAFADHQSDSSRDETELHKDFRERLRTRKRDRNPSRPGSLRLPQACNNSNGRNKKRQ